MSKILVFFSLLCVMGCTQTFHSEKDFFLWLNNENNGLVKNKKVDDLQISLKYLPVDYLVLKDLKGNFESSKANKLKEKYGKGLSFLLTFFPLDDAKDIMYKDLSSYPEYTQRLLSMQFDMAKYIYISTKNGEIRPVLSTLENTYSVTKHRNIYIVFNGDDAEKILQENEIDIVFDDEIFLTGIHHFVFKSRHIKNMPHLSFWKK